MINRTTVILIRFKQIKNNKLENLSVIKVMMISNLVYPYGQKVKIVVITSR